MTSAPPPGPWLLRPAPAVYLTARVEGPAAQGDLVPTARDALAGAERLEGVISGKSFAGWTWQASFEPSAKLPGLWHGRLVIRPAMAAEVALELRLGPLGANPRWLMPGNFYDENRPGDSPRRYPRFGFEADLWTAPEWIFSAERAAAPMTYVQTRDHSAALIADATYWQDVPVGLGLSGNDGSRLVLRYPYAETPRSYAPCRGEACAPVVTWHPVQPDEEVVITFDLFLGAPQPMYAALLRHLYARAKDRGELETRPWMPMEQAAEVLATGLYRWHYDPSRSVLVETCAFDHYFRPSERQTDREAMHVAWLSGIPTAYAMLRHGGEVGEAGRRVIDHIARDGLAPCGAFWAQWKPSGWASCWYGGPEDDVSWLQAATTAEATLFLFKAIAFVDDPPRSWELAARSNLDFVCARQAVDGNLGSYYHALTGEVTLRDGTPGILWISALVAGWRHTGEARYLEAALRAAAHYEPYVLADALRGAPEDVPLGPTSEDGYVALQAYWDLYTATDDPRWLAVARHAADWTLSFRWLYNVRFHPYTFLGKLDFRTVGADLASPSNQHLHTYGLICLPEMLSLWRATGDDYYFERSRDLLAFARQTLTRVDGENNARIGMMTEQWYHVDWTHPQGSMLQLAHAWCNGLAMYAFFEVARFGHLWLGERVWSLEPMALRSGSSPEICLLENPFFTPLTLRIRLLEPWQSAQRDGKALSVTSDELGRYSDLTLAPGAQATLQVSRRTP